MSPGLLSPSLVSPGFLSQGFFEPRPGWMVRSFLKLMQKHGLVSFRYTRCQKTCFYEVFSKRQRRAVLCKVGCAKNATTRCLLYVFLICPRCVFSRITKHMKTLMLSIQFYRKCLKHWHFNMIFESIRPPFGASFWFSEPRPSEHNAL